MTTEEMIDLATFQERLISLCVRRANALLPRNLLDQRVLAKSIALALPGDQVWSEAQVNDQLRSWLADLGRSFDVDHVTLRRFMVDLGFLVRASNGSTYRVAAPTEQVNCFAAEVEQVRVAELIRAARSEEELRRQSERARRGGGA